MAEVGAAISTSIPGRRYDIDALRVFAFGLLIVFHVGMFYTLDWGWHVKSTYQSRSLQFPMMLTIQWRIPLLFLISGLALSFIWGKYSTAQFALRRTLRLLVPLLFGMAFIVSAQCYYEALNKGVIDSGYMTFMGQYLTFQDFPGEAWAGEEQIHWTWNHLWYLPYLLTYTLLLIPVARFIDGPGMAVRHSFQKLRGIWIILVPIAPLMVYYNLFFPKYAYFSRALIDDWYAHFLYGTVFLYGYLIGRDDGFWAELTRLRRTTLLLALTSFAIYVIKREFYPFGASGWQFQANGLVDQFNTWLWIMTVLGWGHHWFNKPAKWLPYATEAVY
ncbi:MAG: acyltransferase family protein, partial [Lysobacterales bacterium]